MERLWAPWRMTYITEEPRPGCLFCRALQEADDPDSDLVLWRPEGAIVMLNKFPYNPGHAMAAPAAHKASFENLDAGESTARMAALARTLQAPREGIERAGCNLRAHHRAGA